MKILTGILVLLSYFAANLLGSVADNVRNSFVYNPYTQQVSGDGFNKAPTTELFVRTTLQRELEARFAPKPTRVSLLDSLDRFTFIANIEEDSILSGIIDKINQINEAYRDMRGGFDANFMGASFTVYARSKIEWKIGKAKTIEIKYAGEKSVSFVWAF